VVLGLSSVMSPGTAAVADPGASHCDNMVNCCLACGSPRLLVSYHPMVQVAVELKFIYEA
jgi:hypothetical protein